VVRPKGSYPLTHQVFGKSLKPVNLALIIFVVYPGFATWLSDIVQIPGFIAILTSYTNLAAAVRNCHNSFTKYSSARTMRFHLSLSLLWLIFSLLKSTGYL
jgi:hypothetical protein